MRCHPERSEGSSTNMRVTQCNERDDPSDYEIPRSARNDKSTAHAKNLSKFISTQRHDRQARLSNERDLLQLSLCFNFTQRDRSSQWLHRNKVDSAPIAFFGGRVAVSRARDFGDANDRFVFAAMIKKHFISLGHAAKIIPRSVIADSGPTRPAVGNKIGPGVTRRFLFYEPEIFHRFNLTRFDICRSLFEDRNHGALAIYHL